MYIFLRNLLLVQFDVQVWICPDNNIIGQSSFHVRTQHIIWCVILLGSLHSQFVDEEITFKVRNFGEPVCFMIIIICNVMGR